MNQHYIIKDETELEDLLGKPSQVVQEKIIAELDETMIAFIARAPLVFLATTDASGRLDVSPKGDAPGFVSVDQAGNLLIPERAGNKLMLGFRNVLMNPAIGLIFVIPNTRETLRVKGVATLTRDPAVLERLSAKNKPALLCTQVDVQECFYHCGKAFIRSKLWQAEHWPQDEKLMSKHFATKLNVAPDDVTKDLEESYQSKLY